MAKQVNGASWELVAILCAAVGLWTLICGLGGEYVGILTAVPHGQPVGTPQWQDQFVAMMDRAITGGVNGICVGLITGLLLARRFIRCRRHAADERTGARPG
jgi:hypothetical protein